MKSGVGISLLRFLVLVACINDEWHITVTTQTVTPFKITFKIQNAKHFLPFQELNRIKFKILGNFDPLLSVTLNGQTALGTTSIGDLYN